MRIYSLAAHQPFPSVLHGGAASIGNFDGVHRGHAMLIQALRKQARRLGGPAVAVTFDPHPLRILAPDRFMPQLTIAADRAEYLLQAGADRVVILQTTPALLQLDGTAFLNAIVRDQLRAKFIVEGFNFAFGKDRQGDINLIDQWGKTANVGMEMVDALNGPDGLPISSSRVRAALDAGDVKAANDLLGRPYRLRGTVVRGERRGTKIGFPTANLANCATVIPGDGVYAGRATTEQGTWAAAVNVGPNPTFGETARKVEAHLLDFKGDLDGAALAIDFVVRLRDVKQFASPEALVAQLHKDVEQARSAGMA